MDYRPLAKAEQRRLAKALHDNVEESKFLKLAADTSFAGTADKVSDEEVVAAIRSVPCHYDG